MTDFSQLKDEQLVRFVDGNFALFASDRDEAFPANVLDNLPRCIFAIIRRMEGFAIAYKGRYFTSGSGSCKADLMFLHVLPEYEGSGIGTLLVEQVKASVTPGLPIILKCEGKARKTFFERCGFAVVRDFQDDNYEMEWTPRALDAS